METLRKTRLNILGKWQTIINGYQDQLQKTTAQKHIAQIYARTFYRKRVQGWRSNYVLPDR